MNAENIRKLADMLTNLNDSDAPWYEEHKYAPVLRACADVVEAAKMRVELENSVLPGDMIRARVNLINALAKLEAL